MTEAVAHPSATVVLLRDAPGEIEVLLVQRSGALGFHGGAWVFPGGRVDAVDRRRGSSELDSARAAAVREAAEEAGARLEPSTLVPFAHWTTPVGRPKRFATWFFAARAGAEPVQVDRGEIIAHRWLSPAAAIAERNAGRLVLPPPTFVTLWELRTLGGTSHILESMASTPVRRYLPRPVAVTGGLCSLYPGDAGYDRADPERVGARHRLWMVGSEWRHERR